MDYKSEILSIVLPFVGLNVYLLDQSCHFSCRCVFVGHPVHENHDSNQRCDPVGFLGVCKGSEIDCSLLVVCMGLETVLEDFVGGHV